MVYSLFIARRGKNMKQTEEKKIAAFLQDNDIEGIHRVLDESEKKSKKMVMMQQVLNILHMEEKQKEHSTILSKTQDMEEVLQQYVQMKLLLRRLDFGLAEEAEIYAYIQKYRVSDSMIVYLVLRNMFHKQQVVLRLIVLFERAEGRDSKRAQYYKRILAGIRE